MCGIVGYVSGYSNGFAYNEVKAFRDMLVVDSLRGFDSTGVFGVSHHGNVELHKAAITGAEFVNTSVFSDFSADATRSGIFMVGHNRAATRGTVNDKNAHPFCVNDNIVLVQNGTYKGDHKHHKNTEVDTEAIAHVLDEHPDNIELALQKINAAYCLVWYSVKDSSLYIIRNDERPMYIAYTKDDGVLFASEKETILLAASRNELKLKDEPYLIAEDHLNVWKLDTKEHTWTSTHKKLNAAYQHKHTPSSSVYTAYDQDYGAVWGLPSRRYNAHQISHRRDTGVSETSITIHTYVYDNKFEKYCVSDTEADEIRNSVMALSRDKQIVVEFEDYLRCNDWAECKAWYLYGTRISAHEQPEPVIYTIVQDKTEEEIIAMLENPFYFVTIPGTPIEHALRGLDNKQMRVCTLFGVSAGQVDMTEEVVEVVSNGAH